MKVVITTFLFTIFCQIGHARSPAVLPTYGISINEVNKPIPQKPGEALSAFSFTERSQPNVSPLQAPMNEYAQKSMKSIPIYFTLFVLALPFIMWFFITHPNKLSNNEIEEPEIEENKENVIRVNFSSDELLSSEESETQESDDEQNDINRKAS